MRRPEGPSRRADAAKKTPRHKNIGLSPASAQALIERPPPGGAADLALRVVAEYATKHGFTMNVVNKPGGGVPEDRRHRQLQNPGRIPADRHPL